MAPIDTTTVITTAQTAAQQLDYKVGGLLALAGQYSNLIGQHDGLKLL